MKNYFLVALAATTMMACRNDNGNGTTTPTPQPAADPVLPIKINNHDYEDNTDNILTMIYNGDKISVLQNVSGADVNRAIFEYTGDLITKITTTDGTSNDVTTYSYTGGRLTSSANTGSEGQYRWTSNTTFTYNADGTVSAQEIERTTMPTNPTNDRTTTTNRVITLTGGQVTKIVESYTTVNNGYQDTGSRTATYGYDAKNAMFKNVKGFSQLAVGLDEFSETFSLTQNNYASMTTQSNWSGISSTHIYMINHDYNANGYPVKSTMMENGTKSSDYIITYNK